MRDKILWNAQRTLDLTDTQFSAPQQPDDLDALRLQQDRHELRLLFTCRVPLSTYVLCSTSRRMLGHVTTPIDSIYIDILCGGVALSLSLIHISEPTRLGMIS